MSSSLPVVATAARRVLVVDDEPQIRDILAAALRRDGYAVTVRASAREALDDLGRGPFDLLVTDLKMPDMNGLDLIRAAKRQAPGMGSVLITAFASTETAVSALRSGADDYLMKPFGLDDLRRVVERVLADRRTYALDQEALHLVREENETLRRERRDTAEALVAVRRDLKVSRRDLERRVRDLEFVAELADLLAGEDLEAIVGTTARITGRRFQAYVTRIEADVGAGVIEAEHREGVEPVALPLPLGALLVERARHEPAGVVRDEVLGQGRPLEALAAGLSVAGRPAGGIVLLRPLISKDDGDTALLAMLARALKPALEAEAHRRRAEANALDVARGLLEALEGRLVGRRGHAERVSDVVRRAADRLGLTPRERRALDTAARLHDIGEVGVPEELLARPGPLNGEEMDVVRAHAVVGARLLEPLGDAARLVRHHHERPDGLGYPDGLREAEIPFGAGLIGVAEAYDAMTHARPYHAILSPYEARAEILRLRGVQFLPRAVDVVLDVIPA
jgi:response regulator RpfG family c-di-GMP phosphodiesterase